MATYKERREQIWMLQVRNKGTQQAWGPTGARYFYDRASVLKEIDEMLPQNLIHFEYRPCRYVAAK